MDKPLSNKKQEDSKEFNKKQEGASSRLVPDYAGTNHDDRAGRQAEDKGGTKNAIPGI